MVTATAALAVALALQAAPPPEDPERQDQPIKYFFQNLGRDIVALPSIDSAVVMGMGAGFTGLVSPFDDRINGWVDEREPAGYTEIGNVIGDGWVQGTAAVATYGIGVWSGQRELAHVGSDLFRAQALNALVTRGAKAAVVRVRPNGGSHSMPSGHSSAAFATAAVLDRHYGVRVAIPAYAVAGFVGWSRIRDDAHWLTDVVLGAAIGTTVGRTIARGHRDNGRWAIVPVASGTRMAIYVVRKDRRASRSLREN